MSSANPRRSELLLAAGAILLCAAAAILVTAQPGTRDPGTTRRASAFVTARPAAPTPSPEPARGAPATLGFELGSAGAATTTRNTQVLASPAAGSPALSRLRAGILLPIEELRYPFVRVLTPCEATGWIRMADVALHPRSSGPPSSLEKTVFLIDPGHGGMQSGATGPNGLHEKDANLAIAWRLAGKLTGARVFLTRNIDFTAGLVYRTRLANALGAHAFVSIHNNSVPDGPSSLPGSETWHQSRSSPSSLLASIVQGELVEALKSFKVSWVADRKAGTRTRLNAKGEDYYGLLRASKVPTVIVEAMFISNAPEAHLLTTPQAQDAVAGALARALKRYAEKAGPDVSLPYAAATGTAGGVPAGCVDPA